MPDQSGLGSITITSREVYDAVVRLTGRVDVLINQQSATQTDVADHETRLRALERARWPLPSAAVLLSLAALIIPFFIK
jgi:prophage DNA circulation protein